MALAAAITIPIFAAFALVVHHAYAGNKQRARKYSDGKTYRCGEDLPLRDYILFVAAKDVPAISCIENTIQDIASYGREAQSEREEMLLPVASSNAPYTEKVKHLNLGARGSNQQCCALLCLASRLLAMLVPDFRFMVAFVGAFSLGSSHSSHSSRVLEICRFEHESMVVLVAQFAPRV